MIKSIGQIMLDETNERRDKGRDEEGDLISFVSRNIDKMPVARGGIARNEYRVDMQKYRKHRAWVDLIEGVKGWEDKWELWCAVFDYLEYGRDTMFDDEKGKVWECVKGTKEFRRELVLRKGIVL